MYVLYSCEKDTQTVFNAYVSTLPSYIKNQGTAARYIYGVLTCTIKMDLLNLQE